MHHFSLHMMWMCMMVNGDHAHDCTRPASATEADFRAGRGKEYHNGKCRYFVAEATMSLWRTRLFRTADAGSDLEYCGIFYAWNAFLPQISTYGNFGTTALCRAHIRTRSACRGGSDFGCFGAWDEEKGFMAISARRPRGETRNLGV